MAVKYVPISISISIKLLAELDELRAKSDENRSEVIERLILDGLKKVRRQQP